MPGAEGLTDEGFPSLLEMLRAARPAWSPDGSQFAFTNSVLAPSPEGEDHHRLWLGKVAEREVVELADSPEALRHVHWDPTGSRLGLVQDGDIPSLRVLTPGEGLSAPLSQKHVRHFAGWSADGAQLAYVVPQDDPQVAAATWAFLLSPDPWARDAVVLTGGDGMGPGETVFSGMRVTFPHWAPRENKLTLWVTYTPSHPSWLSRLMSWGLRPGDPAAVFDVATRKLSWLTVNPPEKIQVGHYHLARREYEEAWKWYAEAAAERPEQPSPTVDELFQRLTSPSDPEFFEYYCLSKLGRDDEAAAKLRAFRTRYLLPTELASAAEENTDADTTTQVREWLDPDGLFANLAENLYVAEVYLSLGAGADGVAYFRQALAEAAHDQARFAAAVALGQVLLNGGQHDAYAELVTETIAPTLHRLWPAGKVTAESQGLDDQSLLYMAGSLSLLPLCAPEFLATLPEDQLTALAGRWEGYAGADNDDASRLVIDLVLTASYEQLGRRDDAQQAAAGVKGNPARGVLLEGEDVRQMIDRARQVGSN